MKRKTLYNFIQDKYGSKRIFFDTFRHAILLNLGFYRKYKKIDWKSAKRIVFICKGNICRSPFAHYYGIKLGINAYSVGTEACTGDSANKQSIIVAKKFDVSLDTHVATKFTDFKFTEGDLIVGFEPFHLRVLEKAINIRVSQLTLLGFWSLPIMPYIADPYGLTERNFIICYNEIVNRVNDIKNRLENLI